MVIIFCKNKPNAVSLIFNFHQRHTQADSPINCVVQRRCLFYHKAIRPDVLAASDVVRAGNDFPSTNFRWGELDQPLSGFNRQRYRIARRGFHHNSAVRVVRISVRHARLLGVEHLVRQHLAPLAAVDCVSLFTCGFCGCFFCCAFSCFSCCFFYCVSSCFSYLISLNFSWCSSWHSFSLNSSSSFFWCLP